MPLFTVKLPLQGDAPYLGAAHFLSWVTYPAYEDDRLRFRFFQSSIISAIRMRNEIDPAWASKPQPIIPALFSARLELIEKDEERGSQKLVKTLFCAKEILLPALLELQGDGEFRIDGFIPTLNNILLSRLLPAFEMSEGNLSTFKSRIWAPARPVSPAALALLTWLQSRVGDGEPMNQRHMNDLFFSIENLREVLGLTRSFRIMADRVTRFEVKKAHTIRFVGVEKEEGLQEKFVSEASSP